jgi:Ca-activated chloride channel family protein
MKSSPTTAVSIAIASLVGALAPGQAEAQWAQRRAWGGPEERLFGQLIASSESVGSVNLPLTEEQLHVDIDGQHATTRLRQSYENQTGMRLEGMYTLHAGLGTRAEGFAYWNGEEKIVGEVFERGLARQVYQNVTRRRRDPGLLEEVGDGVFSFRVSPIEPGERKRVEITYGQWLPRQAAAIELRVPVARLDAQITVTINDGRPLRGISSPTHALEVQRLSSGQYLIRAHKALGAPTALVLRYDVADKPWSVASYLHRDKGQDGFFALTLAAPDLPRSASSPEDVTLVIDRSGSMAGEMLSQARAACVDIVKRLRPTDRVNVMLFDHHVEQLYPEPRALTDAVRTQAVEYIELLEDGGGTDLAGALEAALAAQADGDRPRVVLFFTDGQSAVAPVLEAARADKRDVRVFTVGFGPEVNRPLLSRLASMKRGRFTYIPEASSIERVVAALHRQIDAPVLVDVSLEVDGAAVTRLYPPTLPDLFVDDELHVTGRLRGQGPVTFTLRGKERGKRVSYQARLDVGDDVQRPWVGRLWAEARVDDLLDEIALGGEKPELQGEVTDLALAYNFATPYTAFLAIPATELDPASAHQLSTARAMKAELIRRRPAAARLATADAPHGGETMGREVNGADEGPRLKRPQESRETVQSAPPPARVAMAGEDSEENALAESERPRTLLGKSDAGSSRKRSGGCASCEVGGGGATPFALLVGATLLLVGRRRRRR